MGMFTFAELAQWMLRNCVSGGRGDSSETCWMLSQ